MDYSMAGLRRHRDALSDDCSRDYETIDDDVQPRNRCAQCKQVFGTVMALQIHALSHTGQSRTRHSALSTSSDDANILDDIFDPAYLHRF